jgi:hypothetical protein
MSVDFSKNKLQKYLLGKWVFWRSIQITAEQLLKFLHVSIHLFANYNSRKVNGLPWNLTHTSFSWNWWIIMDTLQSSVMMLSLSQEGARHPLTHVIDPRKTAITAVLHEDQQSCSGRHIRVVMLCICFLALLKFLFLLLSSSSGSGVSYVQDLRGFFLLHWGWE